MGAKRAQLRAKAEKSKFTGSKTKATEPKRVRPQMDRTESRWVELLRNAKKPVFTRSRVGMEESKYEKDRKEKDGSRCKKSKTGAGNSDLAMLCSSKKNPRFAKSKRKMVKPRVFLEKRDM